MKIRYLETFYWVASLKSFRAAAAKLHLTQPAITARIGVLEEDLGKRVFMRDTRGAELTQHGRTLLPYARKLVELDQAIVEVFASSTTVEQTVRLGASETIVGTWLPDFLTQFSKGRPTLNFDLSVDSTNSLRNDLVAREIDIAFLMGPVAEASIENVDLCSFELVFAATPKFTEDESVWTATRLASENILTFSNDTRPYRQIRALLSPYVVGDMRVTSSASLGALLRLAIAGQGICVLPKASIRDEVDKGDLQILKTDFQLPHISFTASYSPENPMHGLISEITRSAVAFLEPRLIKNIYQTE